MLRNALAIARTLKQHEWKIPPEQRATLNLDDTITQLEKQTDEDNSGNSGA